MTEREENQRWDEFSRKVAQGALVGLLPFFASTAYFLGVECLALTSYLTSDSIRTQKELEAVVKEERTNIGMNEDIELIIRRDSLPWGILGYSRKIKENTYELGIDNTAGMRRAVIQHELYHVYDGHCDALSDNQELPTLVLNFLADVWYEPQAIFYHSLGIKL